MFQNAVPAPKVFAKPGKEATYEHVKEVVEKVVQNSVQTDERKDRLFEAVLAAVSGKMTIKDAVTRQDLPASTVHPYVSRARHLLGDQCPPPKIATCAPSALGSLRNLYKGREMPGRSEPLDSSELLDKTIPQNGQKPDDPPLVQQRDSIDVASTCTLPASPPTPTSASSKKKQSQLANVIVLGGNAEQMQTGRRLLGIQLRQILSRYNYRGDRDRLAKAIATVIGDKKSLTEVSATAGIAGTTLSTYVRIARLFVKVTAADSFHYVDHFVWNAHLTFA